MGKEPANPCIPHWIDYRTMAVLHLSYVLLTRIEGFCSIVDRCDRVSHTHGPWHVISLHQCHEGDLTYQLAHRDVIYYCDL